MKTTQSVLREFVLDDSLEVAPLNATNTLKFIESNFRNTVEPGEKFQVDAIGGLYKHRNYLGYLAMAYNKHYGIVVTPDAFWYMILCELATQVKSDPEKYRSIFTESEGKQDVIVITGEMVDMPMHQLIAALKPFIPSDADAFLPSFTTSTHNSEIAFYSAFADMASPYYNYMMLLCGIPKVKILGTEQDYNLLWSSAVNLMGIFKDDAKIHPYLTQVINVLSEIERSINSEDKKYWKDIFSLKRCGSGSQVMVSGWITKFFMNPPKVAYPENFSSHVSIVKYKQLDTQRNFKKYVGLFSSDIDQDEYLVPDFGYFVQEVIQVDPEKMEATSL